MSHFTVLVVGESPEEQLAPFSENLEMPRYVAYTEQQLIDGQRKSIEDYKNSTYAEYLKDPELYASKCKNNAHLEYLQNDFPKKLNFTEDELYQEAIRYYESNDIGEEGEVYSQSNPNSKWDFFQLGGRWAGLIEVNEGVEFNPPNFSWGWSAEDQLEVLSKRKTDSALKKNIANLKELKTFAVLMDGKWYERGEMGWFGVVHDEKDENKWDDELERLLISIPDETLLSVYDCHI